MNIFGTISCCKPDPIFGLQGMFKEDTHPKKVNLTVGVYLEEDGSPPKVLECVKQAEMQIVSEEMTKSYLPLDGDPDFIRETGKLVFGDQYSDKIYGTQTIGGTSALSQCMHFIKDHIGHRLVCSNPTWANHIQIALSVGLNVEYYPYYVHHEFSFDRMIDQLENEPAGSVILFQPACHNPSGIDISLDEWRQVSQVCKDKNLIPFFDIAYQGFAKGLDEDMAPVRLFVEEGHEMFVSYSFSKLLGLYRERVGAAFYIMNDKKLIPAVQSNAKKIIRTNYSNPSSHGGYVAKIVMTNPDLKKIWYDEVERMRKRMRSNRIMLAKALNELEGSNRYDYLANGNGFFSQLRLSQEQVVALRETYHVYLTPTGRINVTGINPGNIDYVIDCLKRV